MGVTGPDSRSDVARKRKGRCGQTKKGGAVESLSVRRVADSCQRNRFDNPYEILSMITSEYSSGEQSAVARVHGGNDALQGDFIGCGP
jgi:hypothetical protein